MTANIECAVDVGPITAPNHMKRNVEIFQLRSTHQLLSHICEHMLLSS